MTTTHPRRFVLVLVLAVAALIAAGCSKSSAPIKASSVETRLKNNGRYTIVQKGFKVPKPLSCTAKLDETKKVATYECTGKTAADEPIVLSGTSTFKELRTGKSHNVHGKIVVTIAGVKKLDVTCVGSGC